MYKVLVGFLFSWAACLGSPFQFNVQVHMQFSCMGAPLSTEGFLFIKIRKARCLRIAIFIWLENYPPYK